MLEILFVNCVLTSFISVKFIINICLGVYTYIRVCVCRERDRLTFTFLESCGHLFISTSLLSGSRTGPRLSVQHRMHDAQPGQSKHGLGVGTQGQAALSSGEPGVVREGHLGLRKMTQHETTEHHSGAVAVATDGADNLPTRAWSAAPPGLPTE